MLSLQRSFEVVHGVCVVDDHASNMDYYTLPLGPRLATRPDAAGREVPQIQVIRYAGDAGTGGFLNCDVDLRIPDDRLAAIRAHLQQTRGLPGLPRLAPPPFVDGSVRMMLFGRESVVPPAPGDRSKPAPAGTVPSGDPSAPRFVLRMNHAAKPSLYGAVQAAFSVELDQEGVTILDAALRGELSPVGVVYSLTYAGLRPAFNVRVSADWDRVQRHLREQTAVNSLIFSMDVDKMVDELVEAKAIVIEADTLIAEGEEGGEAARLGKEEALDEVKEMVLTTFFEPSLDPVQEPGSIVDGAKRVTQLFATAGIGALFSRRDVDLTRIDRKSLNATFSERTAVLRTIYPQGHLSGLLEAVEAGIDPSRFTISVNTNAEFFKRRTVRVISRADWDGDQIASINVALTYGRDTKNVVLDPEMPERTVSWSSLMDDGTMARDVQMSYTVGFKASAGPGRPARLRTRAPETINGDAVEVFPRDLYDVMNVPINAVSFPWERYPTVELSARYRDPANRLDQSAQYLLTQAEEGQSLWSVFLADPANRAIEYSLLFHGADDRDVAGPTVTTADGLIRVADPFPRRRELTVTAPAAIWATVERVFVDCAYGNGTSVQKTESFEFAEELPASQRFSVELIDPAAREIGFTATLLFHDGRVLEVPASVTTENRLLLRPDMKGRRSVAVRPEHVDFAKRSVREIVVETLFEDKLARPLLRFADRVTLQRPDDRGRFEFDYVDAARDGYRYRVIHHYVNGLSKASGWVNSRAPELVVPVK